MGLFGAIAAVASGVLSGSKVRKGLTAAGADVHSGLTAAGAEVAAAGAEVAAEIRQASVRLAEAALDGAHIHGKYIAATGIEFNKTLKEISDDWRSKVENELKLIREEATQALGFGFGIVAFAIILHPFLDAEVKGYTSATRTLTSYAMVLLGDPSALRSAGLSLLRASLVLWIVYSIADLRYTAQLQMVILEASREEMKQIQAEKPEMSCDPRPKRVALVVGHGEGGKNLIPRQPVMQWNKQSLHEIRSSNFAKGVLELSGNELVVRSGGAGQYIVRASVPGFYCQQFGARVCIMHPAGGEPEVIDGTFEYVGRCRGETGANSSIRSHVFGLASLQEGDKVGIYAKISTGGSQEGYCAANVVTPLLVMLELQEV